MLLQVTTHIMSCVGVTGSLLCGGADLPDVSQCLQGRRPTFDYLPENTGSTMHVFEFKGRRILLRRKKGETLTVGWNRRPMEQERLTLSAWGRSPKILQELLQEALNAHHEEESADVNIFVPGPWCTWDKALARPPRALESVILDADLMTDLITDARNFQKR